MASSLSRDPLHFRHIQSPRNDQSPSRHSRQAKEPSQMSSSEQKQTLPGTSTVMNSLVLPGTSPTLPPRSDQTGRGPGCRFWQSMPDASFSHAWSTVNAVWLRNGWRQELLSEKTVHVALTVKDADKQRAARRDNDWR